MLCGLLNERALPGSCMPMIQTAMAVMVAAALEPAVAVAPDLLPTENNLT